MRVLPPGGAPPGAQRLAYLDWLRFIVVLSLAPFHAALSYTGYGVVYVYDDPVRDAVLAGRGLYGRFGPDALRLFTVFLDNWGMHLLFLVSGMGAAHSLQSRGAAAFIGERARRLMLPFGLITLLVIPIQAWLRALDFRTFEGGFLAFYPRFFDGISTGPGSPGHFDWGHLWFLVYLFVFSVAALPLFQAWRRRGPPVPHGTGTTGTVHAAGVLAPALWIALLEAAFRPGWPGYQNLVDDWANVTVYLSFFVSGYLAGVDPRLPEAAERHGFTALVLGLAAFAARLACYEWLPVGAGYQAFHLLAQFLRGLAAWWLVVAAIGLGRRYLLASGPMLGLARDLSFPLYLLHYAPLTAATYLLLGSDLGIWPRWALSVLLSWAVVALCTFVFRYVPPLRTLFGIRAPSGARGLSR
ncbi:MAG: acyltransferase family protein [Piscinibacter sp.]|nr:acyltransferase family protein [Piscinibacter sp.]